MDIGQGRDLQYNQIVTENEVIFLKSVSKT